MGLEFRRATAADVTAFVALEAEVADARLYAPTLDPVQAAAEIGANDLFFVHLGGTVVGTAACRSEADGSCYLSNLAIRPAYAGRGVGRAAVAFLLSRCPVGSRAWLVTHPENAAALRLYQSLGFVVEGRREDCFGDGEPRLVLARGPVAF